MSYKNEFLAQYGSDEDVMKLLNDNNDYAASQEMHKNPTLNADTLLQVHLKGASHSAKIRSLEHPNFKHHGLLDLGNSEIQHHSMNNPSLAPDTIREIFNKTSNSVMKAKVFAHPNCPVDVHDKAFDEDVPDSQVAAAVANPNCPTHRLEDPKNLDDNRPMVVSKILQNPKTPVHVLVKHGVESDMSHFRGDVIDNPGLPYKYASAAIRGDDKRLAARAIWHPGLTKEDFDHHATKPNEHIPSELRERFYPNKRT